MSDEHEVLVSLCIPTNGIIEWVRPVLDSIFAEKNPCGSYEVIVTDNGENAEFEEMMHVYEKKYANLIYCKTDAVQFLNQIEAFKLASGALIKFINHRMALKDGALNYLLTFAEEHKEEKPGVYFLNGAEPKRKEQEEFDTFDSYVGALGYWSSWSAGTAMWQEDFEKIDLQSGFNKMFPHTDLIFSMRKKQNYIIDNTILLEDLEANAGQKGKYDLFHTFAVDYVQIIEDLYNQGDITENTFTYVKKENLKFVMSCYVSFVILKRPCSYDLRGFDQAIRVYYKKNKAVWYAIMYIVTEVGKALRRIIKNN